MNRSLSIWLPLFFLPAHTSPAQPNCIY